MKHKKSFSLPASPSSFSWPAPLLTSASSGKNLPEVQTLPFFELLARSNFSFLQGASHPEEMVMQAKRLGYHGLAIVDVNGFYGIVRGYQAAHRPSAFDTEQLAPQREFQYACGSELTPHDASPLALLPMNKTGYSRLSRLLTKAKRPSPKGYSWVSLDEILEDCEDLIAFPLPPWRPKELKRLQDAFKDRLYLPVYKDFTWEAVTLYNQALRIEAEFNIPLFATQRPLYHLPERKPLHDVLTCILHKTTIHEVATKTSLNSERSLKPLAEISRLWRERPDMITRTLEIASRLKFSLAELRYRYPQEVLPPGKTATEFLRELVEKGVGWRFPNGMPAKGRRLIEHELKLIKELEYEDYFLTLWDICQFADREKILHQGRGSAANSIVCYTLGLTNIDPTQMELLFERFISKERGEPPDIDIDFEHERREEVIQYIYKKYGEHHAAMVCTTICYRSRMAVREVAKVFGLDPTQIKALRKFMGREGLSRLLEDQVAAAQFGLSTSQFRLILRLAVEMQGFPRHLGIHSGGFVIAHDPIVDIVPVEKASMDERYVVQWNKDDINILGLMKIDVLALGMLTAIRKCFSLLKEYKGIEYNMATIPHDDAPTYQMIQKADTIGVFQIESRAQMTLLPRLKPATYYDLVIEVAIVRPGPIQGGMVHPFLKRRAGLEKVTYAHPLLEPILKKTYGVPIFQEQVMQVAISVAGFTPGEADELRRIMSSAWTKGSIMHTLRQRLINGMLEHGIKIEYAEQIYKVIVGFSSYGFPESHAASFALITYVSCYLKHHHPEAFTCALLNSQPLGFYPPRQLISDARRHQVVFYPLDINQSAYDYTLEPSAREANNENSEHSSKIKFLGVRVGFRAVYGLSQRFVDKFVEERERNGAYKNLSDLVRRTELPRTALLRLAAAGAFKCFNLEARDALWMIQGLTLDTQSLLFGTTISGTEKAVSDKAVHSKNLIPKESDWQATQREFQTKGFSLTKHPLAILRPTLPRTNPRYVTTAEAEHICHGTPVRMAGLLSLIQTPPTAKGMCFLSLEDETGIFNVVLVPQYYQKYRLMLQSHSLLGFEGPLENRQGVRHLRAHSIHPLFSFNTDSEASPKII